MSFSSFIVRNTLKNKNYDEYNFKEYNIRKRKKIKVFWYYQEGKGGKQKNGSFFVDILQLFDGVMNIYTIFEMSSLDGGENNLAMLKQV